MPTEAVRDILEVSGVAFALGLAFMVLSIIVWRKYVSEKDALEESTRQLIEFRDAEWEARTQLLEEQNKMRLAMMAGEVDDLRKELLAERASRQALERLLAERLGIEIPSHTPNLQITAQGDVTVAGDVVARDKQERS